MTTKRDDDERGDTTPIQVSLLVQFSSITSTNSNGEQQRRQQQQPQIIYITHTSAVHTANKHKQTNNTWARPKTTKAMYVQHALADVGAIAERKKQKE